MNRLEKVKGKLIVSCQALEDEPLHSSFIMGRMAYAALVGGASGIRANTVSDIQEIKKNVNLPIIGIIKQQYGDNQVYITPTMKEIDALAAEGVEVIALDGTKRERPDGNTLENLMREAKTKYPNQLFMADISSVEEAVEAERIGFDIVGTTLVGYTEYTKGNDPLTELEKVIKAVTVPVIGEGNIDTPVKAKKALELGAYAVVVGGAITRPQQITKKFVTEMEK
ncbi:MULTISPECIES: N-acetylmannosamine-6-phosphate 2-epimerase [Fusobacterium]|jgi:N-acylglucosamine-6-phosphate 2-epimerase|uniref:Putative N-acetylmannosamine-6-phosphate 2-epimerase n=1 Tax=Fusobacterium varium ATCC 27725 TaxID=469618 RepID=A0ABM6U2H1_FUSVA|nr:MULTISPECIES: N-acetylmannosamine-6-phosphate 2-epimerase [Fusobacterium]AVQ30417.1 N-acetylmannosamine-6-phosphate 2-epimerase [Fusobacterium varium ATCC 27725]EES64544.1 N-acetylmannosamine-6-P epimerase [Fusobacterium varium ATCC 27725]MCF0168957.1 N-acetylmannosamine-6-phosphate 2-epimerase [Fusobacterium varium]MCF2673499.1 N-acetylmannosamine-6-phosphate 2-epimerase [Fusobacterium varium]MCI6032051.1 N-acetylmannosamine-6-phosphate 2-epimerase [Fusobacterium varium]